MFITLRSSGGQAEAGGNELEQVARCNAGARIGKAGVRAARRPACVACQTKKLRCTGSSPRTCDRCRARLITCVLPARNGQDKNRTDSSHLAEPSNTSRGACQEVGDASLQPGHPPREPASGEGGGGANLGLSKPPQQAAITAPRAPVGVDPLDGGFFDHEFTFVDPADQAWPTGLTTTAAVDLLDGLDVDIDDLDSAPVEVPSGMGSVNSGCNDAHQPNKSPRNSYGPVSQAQPPDTTAQVLCSCLTDLVRVVQQLDDDEFHITTMSLDQVLRLQKWLIFQCCKPLDCPKCLDLSTIHTMRLILCDRLTEMFECIHLRVKRAGAILAGQSSDSSSLSTPSPLPDPSYTQSHSSLHPGPVLQQPPTGGVGSGPLPAQLFCGSSGRAANTAACNPLMFSDEFRNQYSDEEQVHMIRVLLRLQSRNFQKLLSRVENTSQVAASQARQAKVRSMMVRLAKASADIEGALRVVFQGLAVG